MKESTLARNHSGCSGIMFGQGARLDTAERVHHLELLELEKR